MEKPKLPNPQPVLERASFFTLKDRVRMLKRSAKNRAEHFIAELENATGHFPFSLNLPFHFAGGAATGLIDVADKLLHELVSFDPIKIKEANQLIQPQDFLITKGQSESYILGSYYFLLNRSLKALNVEGYYVSELAIYRGFKNFCALDLNDAGLSVSREFVVVSDASFASACFVYSLLLGMPVKRITTIAVDDEVAISQLRKINMVVCVAALLSVDIYEMKRVEDPAVDVLDAVGMAAEIASAIEEDLLAMVKTQNFHVQLAKQLDLIARHL